MEEEIDLCMEMAGEQMQQAIEHLANALSKLRAGKAHPQMLSGVFVEYYGVNSPLNQVSSITTPDAKTLMVQPFEKNILSDIEKAIVMANLGLTPMNDGKVLRIPLPTLTEERRKELVKKVKQESENSKVSVRSIRREAMETTKKMVKDGLPEDQGKTVESQIQELTDRYSTKVDEIVLAKEKEIMTV